MTARCDTDRRRLHRRAAPGVQRRRAHGHRGVRRRPAAASRRLRPDRGVDVGKVKAIALDPGARSSTVTMQLDSSAGPCTGMPAPSCGGGRYSAPLTPSPRPGTPAAGPLGGNDSTEPDEQSGRGRGRCSLSIAGPRAPGLQAMPRQLAAALRIRLRPRRRSRRSPPYRRRCDRAETRPAAPAPDLDLQRFVSATAETVRALDTPTDEARTLSPPRPQRLQTDGRFAGRHPDSTISQAPGALISTARPSLNSTARSPLADPLLASSGRPRPSSAHRRAAAPDPRRARRAPSQRGAAAACAAPRRQLARRACAGRRCRCSTR